MQEVKVYKFLTKTRSYHSVQNSLRVCCPTKIPPALLYGYEKWFFTLSKQRRLTVCPIR